MTFHLDRPANVTLGHHEIHVWFTRLLGPPSTVTSLYSLLSPGEKDRAARFRFEEHRNEFIVGHGVLRSVLSFYVGVAPSDIELSEEPGGKLVMSDSNIYFNMSHSNGLALFALAREPQLGVDIEWIRDIPVAEMDTLALQVFSEGEIADLMATNPGERTRAFFSGWTRKEAYVKATGEGLAAPLNRFRVSIGVGQPAALLHIEDDMESASDWSLFDLKAPDGYVGALAIHGRGWAIKQEYWAIT
jgi:4'-phosphopantetheinyl transferase